MRTKFLSARLVRAELSSFDCLRPIRATLAMTCAVLILTSASPASAQPTMVTLLAKAGWMDTGVDVPPGYRLLLDASGQWTNGGDQTRLTGPKGFPGFVLAGAEAPSLPFASLIARVGSNVFEVGEKYVGRPAQGASAPTRLFLAMNDVKGGYADNSGSVVVRISVTTSIVDKVWRTIAWKPAEILGLMRLPFIGGRLQLSQTDQGVPLTLKVNGVAQPFRSYVAFGPALSGSGLEGIPLGVPDQEYDVDKILGRDTHGLAAWGEFTAAFGGGVMVDRVRWLLNNVHADFDTDLAIKLADGDMLLDLTLQAPNPAARGEGNGYLITPIPIPLGFRDGLCPDITLDGLHLVVHITPFVDGGSIRLKPLRAELLGNVKLGVFDTFVNDYKSTILNTIQGQINAQLATDAVRKPLEKALAQMLLQGKPNVGVADVTIEPTGVTVFFAGP